MIIKKRTLVLLKLFISLTILQTNLFASNHTHMASDDGQEQDIDSQYFVHLSTIMSEDSTKIAGAQMLSFDNNFKSSLRIEPEGSNIRLRITLHHCFGCPVINSEHGSYFKTKKGTIRVKSSLHSNRESCAFLDPLSAFRGEIVGGSPGDIMTLDRHVYGEKSVVIIPIQRKQEFESKNSTFLGKRIFFDPDKISVAQKVEEYLTPFSNQINYKYLKEKMDEESRSFLSLKTLQEIRKTFEKENWIFMNHNLTYFKALELCLAPFNRIIHLTSTRKHCAPLPADQVFSRTAMVESILELMMDDLMKRSLNENKKTALKSWQKDLLNWMNLFKIDALLRQKHEKSIFIKNPFFQDFIKNKHDENTLLKMAVSLEKKQKKDLKLDSLGLFPELLEETFFVSPPLEELIDEIGFSILISLKKRLGQKGFKEHGNGLILIRLLREISNNHELFNFFPTKIKELKNCLHEMNSDSRLNSHIKQTIKTFVSDDKSYRNKLTLRLLNSDMGKLLQRQMRGQDKDVSFMNLLQVYDGTQILFANLDKLKVSSEENLTGKYNYFKSRKLHENRVREDERKFVEIVRKWLIRKALEEPESSLKSRKAISNSKTPQFSLFNAKHAENTLTKSLNLYRQSFMYPLNYKCKYSLNSLIEQGCFNSWEDLRNRCLPLENVTEEDMKIIESKGVLTLFDLYYEIKNHISKKMKVKQENKKIIQEALEKDRRMKALIYADTITIEQMNDAFEYFTSKASFIISDTEYPRYKVGFLLNSAFAWGLYHKLGNQSPHDKDLQYDLYDLMEPVFNEAIIPSL